MVGRMHRKLEETPLKDKTVLEGIFPRMKRY